MTRTLRFARWPLLRLFLWLFLWLPWLLLWGGAHAQIVVPEFGVRGTVLADDDSARGVKSSREAAGDFEHRAAAVVVTSGGIGHNHELMRRNWPTERVGAAVSNLAHARQILDETIAYAKERQAFGQPIGSFQVNKHKLAELVTQCEVTQAFIDACIMQQLNGTLSAVDAAKAKWWSAEVQNSVLDACVQLWGGYGYMNEYRVARAWADARVTRIWAGSNEIMKELIGRDLGL